MFRKYVDVWVKRPVQNAFTYLVPEDLPNKPGIGHRVIVPFHGQELEGIICGMHRNDPEYTVQPLVRVIDPEPILNAEQLELVPWMAQTYLAGPGECVFKMVPRGRRWPEAASNRLSRKIQPEKRPLTEHSLNKEQNAALVSILIDLKRNCQKNTEGGGGHAFVAWHHRFWQDGSVYSCYSRMSRFREDRLISCTGNKLDCTTCRPSATSFWKESCATTFSVERGGTIWILCAFEAW